MDNIAPIAFCVLLWWLGTGIVLRLDSVPKRSYRSVVWVYSILVVVVLLSVFGLRSITTVWSAYASFSGALVFWGWLEWLHYSGFLIGPRKQPCPLHVSTWGRFVYAFQAMLFHELAIAAGVPTRCCG